MSASTTPFRAYPSSANIPLWKWLVDLIFGITVFFGLYLLAQDTLTISSPAPRVAAMLLASAGALALFLVWVMLFEKRWRTELFTRNVRKNLELGITIGVIFCFVYVFVLLLTENYEGEYASPQWMMVLSGLAYYLLVACFEEVVFRGMLFRMMDERLGMWWALSLTTLLFGIGCYFINGSGIWGSVVYAVEGGLLLSAAYKCSGSLWLPIAIHWAWNFSQDNVFGLFPADGGKGCIVHSEVSGPDYLTGSIFGPEASISMMILAVALSILFVGCAINNNRANKY